MIWFGWVLWHIDNWRLFNAKSSLYIYIKYIWFVNISQKSWIVPSIALYYNSIKHQSFVYTQLNDQTVLFKQFNSAYVICLHSAYQVLQLQTWEDRGEMAMKGYSSFAQSSSITGTPLSYPGHLLGRRAGYPSVGMLSVYFTAPAYWVGMFGNSRSHIWVLPYENFVVWWKDCLVLLNLSNGLSTSCE